MSQQLSLPSLVITCLMIRDLGFDHVAVSFSKSFFFFFLSSPKKSKLKNNQMQEYASKVMTSFHYASLPSCGNWLQTNQPEHEFDDCAGDTVTFVCVTNE